MLSVLRRLVCPRINAIVLCGQLSFSQPGDERLIGFAINGWRMQTNFQRVTMNPGAGSRFQSAGLYMHVLQITFAGNLQPGCWFDNSVKQAREQV